MPCGVKILHCIYSDFKHLIDTFLIENKPINMITFVIFDTKKMCYRIEMYHIYGKV